MNVLQFLSLPESAQRPIVGAHWNSMDRHEPVGLPNKRTQCPLINFFAECFPGEVLEIDFYHIWVQDQDGGRERRSITDNWMVTWQRAAADFAPEGRITAEEAVFILEHLSERYTEDRYPVYRTLDDEEDEADDDEAEDEDDDEAED